MPVMSQPTVRSRRSSGAPADRVSIPSLSGAALTFLLLLSAVACDRNIEPYQPGEESRPPDLARIFPAPSPGEGEASGEQTAAARGALPPSRAEGSRTGAAGMPPMAAGPASAGTSDASAAAPIEGRIEIDPALAQARPTDGVLFVIARPQGARGGPPLAVLRIPSPEFPLEFSIGPDNVMIPTMQFAGSISLSARLDADGNAMTRGPDDISSPVMEPLAPGTTGVRLLLSERG